MENKTAETIKSIVDDVFNKYGMNCTRATLTDRLNLLTTDAQQQLKAKQDEIERLGKESQNRHELVMLKVDTIISQQKEIEGLKQNQADYAEMMNNYNYAINRDSYLENRIIELEKQNKNLLLTSKAECDNISKRADSVVIKSNEQYYKDQKTISTQSARIKELLEGYKNILDKLTLKVGGNYQVAFSESSKQELIDLLTPHTEAKEEGKG